MAYIFNYMGFDWFKHIKQGRGKGGVGTKGKLGGLVRGALKRL